MASNTVVIREERNGKWVYVTYRIEDDGHGKAVMVEIGIVEA